MKFSLSFSLLYSLPKTHNNNNNNIKIYFCIGAGAKITLIMNNISWTIEQCQNERMNGRRPLNRMNVTMQGGQQTLPGMQGTNSNHMSGSSQLMVPGFPLSKSSQPYSPSR
jgi:hypothetical protein